MHCKYLEDRFNIYNEMNHGRYAIVYRAVDKRNGKEVAIKAISKDVLKAKELSNEYLVNERSIFDLLSGIDRCDKCDEENRCNEGECEFEDECMYNSKCNCARAEVEIEDGRNNVIRFYDYRAFNDAEFIIMELINGYDMQREVFERFNSKNRVQYTFKKRIDIMLQLIQGVKYLHNKHIYHGDLKPENIMLTDERVVIVDFGCAFYSRRGRERANKFFMKGTPGFCAPEISDMEVLDREVELAKLDVWALCCSFYYLFEGKLPFRDENFNDVRFNEVVVALRYDKECNDEVLRICEKVFVDEPAYRLTLEQFKEEIENMKEC